jgi:hypothetical protein
MKPSKFVSELFNGIFGKNFFTRKPNLSCKQEQQQLKGSFFQHSLLAPVLSYGQKIPLNHSLKMIIQDVKSVSRDTATGPIAKSKLQQLRSLKSNRPTNNKSLNNNSFEEKEGFGSLNFQTIKIRLTNTLYELWANPRLRTGLIILLVIAPLSKFFYLIFPKEGFGLYLINNDLLSIPNLIEGSHWYFYSLFFFFFSLTEFLTPLLTTIGVFFLFPKNYYPSYLCGVPVGYYLALLLNRITVISNAEFHLPVTISFIFSAILFTVFLLYMSDKVLFKTNHRKRAIEARILGLINMPGMSWKDKEELLKREAKDAMKANNELFNRAG